MLKLLKRYLNLNIRLDEADAGFAVRSMKKWNMTTRKNRLVMQLLFWAYLIGMTCTDGTRNEAFIPSFIHSYSALGATPCAGYQTVWEC